MRMRLSHHLIVPAATEHLRRIRDFFETHARRFGMESRTRHRMKLVLDEAVTNIILHGYAGSSGEVYLILENVKGSVHLTIHDRAPVHNPLFAPEPDYTLPLAERPLGGMGVDIMRRFTDHVSHRPRSGGGNTLTLKKAILGQTNQTPEREDMDINQEVVNGVLVIAPQGNVDAMTAPDLERTGENLVTQGFKTMVLDMSGVRFVSSAGIRAVQALHRATVAAGGDMRLAALRPATREVFETVGFTSQNKLYTTVEDAVGSFAVQGTETRREGDVIVVTPHGDLDAHSSPDLEKFVMADINADHYKIVVDMDGVAFIASAGFRVLQNLTFAARYKRGDVRYARLNARVYETFEAMGYLEEFKVFKTVEEAIASF